MTAKQVLAFIETHGLVLASAQGPVPRLAEAIARGPIKGSWWAHPESHKIFSALQAASESRDVLVCRLVNGKVTFVHRRLWPALVRVAKRFPPERIAQVHEEHTASGRHAVSEVAFPDWVPADVARRAKALSEEQALESLGAWAQRA